MSGAPLIALVGASGWIGRHVLAAASVDGPAVRAISRSLPASSGEAETTRWHAVGAQASEADLATLFQGASAVINVAGSAHLDDRSAPGIEDFANVELPRRIVKAAAAVGITRVVHLSSIKAVGEGGDRPLRADSQPAPSTQYGRSKLHGEQRAREAAVGVELSIVRVPLVHGPGAPGNLARIAHLVERGIPVPLPVPHPLRSVTHVGNLASLLLHLAMSPQPPPLVHWTDLPHLRTDQLVSLVARRSGRAARTVPVPGTAVGSLFRLLGRSADIDRLLRPLVVEPTPTGELGWEPPYPDHTGFNPGWTP